MNHKLDTDDAVYFYEQEFYVLSNFSAFRLTWNGIDFDTSEHAYHWSKFKPNFHSSFDSGIKNKLVDVIRESIKTAKSAHDAFKIAEQWKELGVPYWNEVKVETMRNILICKVIQHEYVRRKLLETGTRELIEDSWRDDFWGWGADGLGQNMLGKLWMEIRNDINNDRLLWLRVSR